MKISFALKMFQSQGLLIGNPYFILILIIAFSLELRKATKDPSHLRYLMRNLLLKG